MKVVKFKHDIGSRVRVIALEICGMVDAMMYDSGGEQYHVVYWSDGVRQTVWMYDWEIERSS